jgi:hypothetical protein
MRDRRRRGIALVCAIVALTAVGTRWLGTPRDPDRPGSALSVSGFHLGDSARWPHWWGLAGGEWCGEENGVRRWTSHVAFIADPYSVGVKEDRFVYVSGHSLCLNGRTLYPNDGPQRGLTEPQVRALLQDIAAQVPGHLSRKEDERARKDGESTLIYTFEHGKLSILFWDFDNPPQFYLEETP